MSTHYSQCCEFFMLALLSIIYLVNILGYGKQALYGLTQIRFKRILVEFVVFPLTCSILKCKFKLLMTHIMILCLMQKVSVLLQLFLALSLYYRFLRSVDLIISSHLTLELLQLEQLHMNFQ